MHCACIEIYTIYVYNMCIHLICCSNRVLDVSCVVHIPSSGCRGRDHTHTHQTQTIFEVSTEFLYCCSKHCSQAHAHQIACIEAAMHSSAARVHHCAIVVVVTQRNAISDSLCGGGRKIRIIRCSRFAFCRSNELAVI